MKSLTLILAGLAMSASLANAQTCPAVGQDTDCGVLITVTDKGATVTITGQGPFDGIEDTLVGVVNNSKLPIVRLGLKGQLPIFDFDGDGLVTFGIPGNGQDNTGYGGPNAFFTNINASRTAGTVNFIVPIAANGGTGFFSLEEALGGATSCTAIINKAVKRQRVNENICATFTPKRGFTLQQAAQLCGFKDFDWVQKITHQNDPSEFFARNIDGAFDPAIVGPVRLTSARVPWADPPQGGGYTYSTNPDFSFPFYYDPAVDLPDQKDGTNPPACTLANAGAGKTLTFHDAPGDGCLRGGDDVGTLACDFTSEPKGSYGGYVTHLAGVNFDGTATDLGIGFAWISTYNGHTGGIRIKKTLLAGDDDGTGGIAILDVNDDTTVQFDDTVTVTTVNDIPPAGFPALSAGNACDGTFSGSFTGDINISDGQNCTLVNGNITGNIQQHGGSLTLTGTTVDGSVNVHGHSAFSSSALSTILGDLIVNGEGDNTVVNPSSNQVCGTIVAGNLHVLGYAIALQIGSNDDTICAGNLVGGDLNVNGNKAPISVLNNVVAGDFHATGNRGTTAIFSDIVTGSLQCQANASLTGGGNNAQQKLGQCLQF